MSIRIAAKLKFSVWLMVGVIVFDGNEVVPEINNFSYYQKHIGIYQEPKIKHLNISITSPLSVSSIGKHCEKSNQSINAHHGCIHRSHIHKAGLWRGSN
jgi:hypothetical protein